MAMKIVPRVRPNTWKTKWDAAMRCIEDAREATTRPSYIVLLEQARHHATRGLWTRVETSYAWTFDEGCAYVIAHCKADGDIAQFDGTLAELWRWAWTCSLRSEMRRKRMDKLAEQPMQEYTVPAHKVKIHRPLTSKQTTELTKRVIAEMIRNFGARTVSAKHTQ